MKVNKKRLVEALNYINLVNAIPLDELDLSEFHGNQNILKKEIDDFKFTGLNNQHFITMNLLEYDNNKFS